MCWTDRNTHTTGGAVQFVLVTLNCALEMKQEICRGVCAVCVHTHSSHKHMVQLVLWNIPDWNSHTLYFSPSLWSDPKHRAFRGSHIIPLKIYNKEMSNCILLTECDSEKHQDVFQNTTESNISVSRFQCVTFSMLCMHSG